MRVIPEKILFYPDSPRFTAIGPDWPESGGAGIGGHPQGSHSGHPPRHSRAGAASSVDARQDLGQPLSINTNIARVSE